MLLAGSVMMIALDHGPGAQAQSGPVGSSAGAYDVDSEKQNQQLRGPRTRATDKELRDASIAETRKYYKNRGPKFGSTYYLLKYNEDWSYLRYGMERPDAFDSIKFIPLNEAGDVYLTLNGEARFRYESIGRNNNFGLATTRLPNGALRFGAQDDLNLLRIRSGIGADLHVTKNFRAYAEILSGQQLGRLPAGAVVSAFQDTDVQLVAGFVEPKVKVDDAWLGVRAGRQSVYFGNGLLISTNPNSNIPAPVWDGANGYVDGGTYRFDAFAFKQVFYAPEAFGQVPSNSALGGAYLSVDLPSTTIFGNKAQATVEGFYYNSVIDPSFTRGTGIYYDRAFLNGQAITPRPFSGYNVLGRDDRHTFGGRVFGTVGPVDYDVTGAYQGGRYGNYDVRAFMVQGDLGYTLDAAWRPRFGLRGGLASGGANAGDRTLSTFQPLASNLFYYTESNLIAPTNFYNVSARLRFTPLVGLPNLSVEAYYATFWRYSQNDAVYFGLWQNATAPQAFPVTGAVSGSKIGNQPAVIVNYQPTEHLNITGSVAYFMVGSALRNAGAKDFLYGRLQAILRF